MERPIPDSYWVEPERFLAGEYPRDRDEVRSRRRLTQFLQAGVDFFLDLTQENEYDLKGYSQLLRDSTVHAGNTAVHLRLPIRDMGVPFESKMVRILDAIDSALENGHVVYVHCYGGIGRTGTVVGCYLVRHGLSGANALKGIARLRQGIPHEWVRSPETEAQQDMVRTWPTGA